MSNKKPQKEILEKNYKNLARLINRAEKLDNITDREDPYKYDDLFNDKEILWWV